MKWKLLIALLLVVGMLIVVANLVAKNRIQLTNVKNPIIFILTLTALGLADSVNPCMISLMAIMVANLAALGLTRKDLAVRAGTFTVTVFLTYFLLGVLIYFGYSYLYTLSIAVNGFNVLKAILVAILAVTGIINIRDGILEKKSIFSVPDSVKPSFQKLLNYVSLAATILLAVFTTLVELPCTGIFYFGLIAYMHSNGLSFTQTLLTLLYYNILFIIPELIITIFVWKGMEPKDIYKIYKTHRKAMRICEGVVLIALAILVWMFVKVG